MPTDFLHAIAEPKQKTGLNPMYTRGISRGSRDGREFAYMSLAVLNELKKNRDYFKGSKIVVVGDIALDQTFLCRQAHPGVHATHGQEINYDIEPDGDDGGWAGAANNISVFCHSFDADASLTTVVGNDEEGSRIERILQREAIRNQCLRLEGVQTVTRFRFYIFNEKSGGYDFLYRMNKEPALEASYSKSERAIKVAGFMEGFQEEVNNADVLLFSDYEKGFLSPGVLAAMGCVLEKANLERRRVGRPEIITVVDPRDDWRKFGSLRVDILKPNHKEACRAVGLTGADFVLESDSNLKMLLERVYKFFGTRFPRIVVTLGHRGAALLDVGYQGAQAYEFPAIQGTPAPYLVATACGEVFDAALALALAVGQDIFAAVTFANCAASLQFGKRTGVIVNRLDLLETANMNHIYANYRSHKQITGI